MTDRLSGKRAVVTGAAQGMGWAITEAFLTEGAEVWAVDVNMTTLAELKTAFPRAHTMVVDVRDDDRVAELAVAAAPVDVLVNCAGIVHHGSILECSVDDLESMLDVNLVSMYRTISAFLPGMVERGAGSIINMASVISSVTGAPKRFAYGVSKAAVIGLTKSVAADYIGQGVRVNAVCPGTIDTPSLQDRLAAFDDPQAARRDFVARQPMGRLGSADEIAALVVHLASDESGFTTGAIHIADGGMTM
jgi:2-keto-3-deoxy-L-fuconate dehydrogenase